MRSLVISNREWKLTIFSGDEEIDPAGPGNGPHLHDGGPQLEVGLVHLRAFTDVDLEIISD